MQKTIQMRDKTRSKMKATSYIRPKLAEDKKPKHPKTKISITESDFLNSAGYIIPPSTKPLSYVDPTFLTSETDHTMETSLFDSSIGLAFIIGGMAFGMALQAMIAKV